MRGAIALEPGSKLSVTLAVFPWNAASQTRRASVAKRPKSVVALGFSLQPGLLRQLSTLPPRARGKLPLTEASTK
jgi:hypothetical protein